MSVTYTEKEWKKRRERMRSKVTTKRRRRINQGATLARTLAFLASFGKTFFN